MVGSQRMVLVICLIRTNWWDQNVGPNRRRNVEDIPVGRDPWEVSLFTPDILLFIQPHVSLAQASELNSNSSSQSSNRILVSCSEACLGKQKAAAAPHVEASFSAMLPLAVNWSYHLFLIILHSSPVTWFVILSKCCCLLSLGFLIYKAGIVIAFSLFV